jgi:hypothetical protein
MRAFRMSPLVASIASITLLLTTACADVTAPTSARTAGPVFSGTNSGGVNSGGVNTGGGTGGGGSTTPSGPCATITSFSNSDGYYRIWAAIWTKFSFVNNCGAGVTVSFTYTNGLTGNVDYTATAWASSGTIDEDWAAFSTPYTVQMVIRDLLGNVLDSRSAVVTTKAGKSGTGA